MNFSVAEENYIKAIWHLQHGDRKVSTNELAAELNTKAASVTDMLKRLKEKKLLHYEPYYGVQLNPEGRKLALSIIRKHRLWEYFLVEKLKFTWDEVHTIAEELEHVSSQELIRRLDAYLGFPRFDPHGDPIPDGSGKMESLRHIRLQELPELTHAVVTGVGDQSSSLLDLLSKKHISIGTRLQVLLRNSYDGSLEVRIGSRQRVTLSEQLAQKIFVTKA